MTLTTPFSAAAGGGDMLKANNLGDLASYPGARDNIHLASRADAHAGMGGIETVGAGNSAAVDVPAVGTNIAAGDFSFWLRFLCPASFTSGDGMAFVGSALTAWPASLLIIRSSATDLDIRLNAATSGRNGALLAGFTTAYAGTVVDLVLTRTGTTFKVYVNGVDTTYTDSSSSPVPSGWDGILTSTVAQFCNYDSAHGQAATYYRAALFSACLTAAQVRTMCATGYTRGLSALFDLDFGIGVGYVATDRVSHVTPGSGHGLISGSTWYHTRPDFVGQITGRLSWAGTNESKYLLADTQLLPPAAKIESIVLKASAGSSGTGITVGDGSSATRFCAAQTYTTTRTSLTLANAFTDGTNVKIAVVPDSAAYTGNLDVTVNYTLPL